MNKQQEYNIAMNKYHNNIFYKNFGIVISIIIICLQFISLYNVKWSNKILSPIYLFYIFIIYAITDLFSGIAHMYMDNNDKYTSLAGPFIAAFHLHHKQPKYKDRHPLAIYFYESGTKYWLVLYLICVIYLQKNYKLKLSTNFILTGIGILSSISEVSHYLCHNSNNWLTKILQKYHILLSPKHHFIHHEKDNINYAFMNGMTDPLLNIIARNIYGGYINNTDQHYKNYKNQTSNRS